MGTRIRASIPTVEYLVSKGAKVLLSSHLGRPKSGPEDKFSLGPVAPRLSELLGKDVVMAPDCIGEGVKECVDKMADGDVLLLENTRFYKEEEKNVPEFAEKLAANADLFVNDAFGTAHRAHGSTEGVTNYLSPSVAGFLLQKELDYLDGAVSEPKRPFAAIVGGCDGRGDSRRLDGSRQRPGRHQGDPGEAVRLQDRHLERPHGRLRVRGLLQGHLRHRRHAVAHLDRRRRLTRAPRGQDPARRCRPPGGLDGPARLRERSRGSGVCALRGAYSSIYNHE